MKVLWILLGLLPSILWAAEQPRQWLDRKLQPVDADSDKAVYYHAPAVRDGENWQLTVYYKSDGEAVPALKLQLDGPDLASANKVGEQNVITKTALSQCGAPATRTASGTALSGKEEKKSSGGIYTTGRGNATA